MQRAVVGVWTNPVKGCQEIGEAKGKGETIRRGVELDEESEGITQAQEWPQRNSRVDPRRGGACQTGLGNCEWRGRAGRTQVSKRDGDDRAEIQGAEMRPMAQRKRYIYIPKGGR